MTYSALAARAAAYAALVRDSRSAGGAGMTAATPHRAYDAAYAALNIARAARRDQPQ